VRVPCEWLRELVEIEAAPDEIAERLTMLGLEVEGSESVGDDIVFEVNVTPNRPDCLSMIGIARELSAAFGVPLKMPQHDIGRDLSPSGFSVEILNPGLCRRYTGRVIKGVRISASPQRMKERLEKCGIRSINNVVDVTNYVLLEFGHPLHSFDADTIEGRKIVVDTAGADSKIVTLDGVERALPEDALLIQDSKRPIAIAGIMGGSGTDVSEKTQNIFLESAHFESFSVRRTSKRLNLATESSYRFERGTDIEFLEDALNRAALMITEVAGGTIHEIIDVYPVKFAPESFNVSFVRINKMLGTTISKAALLSILGRLGISAEDKGDNVRVYPPSHRRDIRRDCDVAEEVARVFGFNMIPTTVPRSPLSSGRLSKRAMNMRRVREGIRKSGFTEVINYSFMSASALDMIGMPDSDRRRKVIFVNNPLSQEEGLLRTTLAPALIANLKYNLDRGMKDIRLFEISKVFEDIGNTLPSEEGRLGGILYREKVPSLWKEDASAFFIAKGAIESMLEELKIFDYSYFRSSEPFLHKGQSADIFITGSRVGYLGVLSPEVIERLELKKQKPEIVLFELDLDLLLRMIPDSIRYVSVARYPSVERDIAIVVDETMPSSDVMEIIRAFPSNLSNLIEEITVFDYFRGGNIPPGKKSLAFSIVYRSKDRTLREEEVEGLHASLLDYLVEKTGGEIRK
jgi:phenylalanyl-tRNA synthetase beta chain